MEIVDSLEMQTHTIKYELYTIKFISCHVHKTHSFDVIVVANENVVIVMGIYISIFFCTIIIVFTIAISDNDKTVWGQFCQLPGRTSISRNRKTQQIYMKPFLTIFYTPNSWQKNILADFTILKILQNICPY
jgi:hypothetical protein